MHTAFHILVHLKRVCREGGELFLSNMGYLVPSFFLAEIIAGIRAGILCTFFTFAVALTYMYTSGLFFTALVALV